MFKYRSNGKWYTFDKSLLEAADAAIFDKMSYPDKLKLITIYTQLKPKENDDVVILKTRKEDSKKDVRRAEYLKKKEKIEADITKATKETDKNKADAMLAKAQEDLKNLNVEYADVVGITTANEVNVAKANKVVLQDVKQLITSVNEDVNALKGSLSKDTIDELKNNIAELLSAKDAANTKEIIEQMSQTLADLKASDYSQATNELANRVNDSINELKKLLEFDPNNKVLDAFIGWISRFKLDTQDQAYILRNSAAITDMGRYKITLNDAELVVSHPKAMEAIGNVARSYDEAFKLFKLMSSYIATYKLLKENVEKPRYMKLLNEDAYGYKNEFTSANLVSIESQKYPNPKIINITTTDMHEIDNKSFDITYNTFVKEWKLGKPNRTDYLVYHENKALNEKSRKAWVYFATLNWCDNGAPINPSMKEIMDNPIREELNKTGAVETEGNGVFGIQTKKSAKRDNEALTGRLLGIIDELKIRIKQNEEDINRLFEKLNEREVVKEDIRPITKPNFLTDITKPITLKHTQDDRHLPVVKEPDEVDDLVKALNKRRIDIEYSDDSDDDYVWGDGVVMKGGVLAELKRDLEKYGLVFNPSKDGKSYYLTVFNRKKVDRSAGGVEEAKEIVDFAKQQGNELRYHNLKELYEEVY